MGKISKMKEIVMILWSEIKNREDKKNVDLQRLMKKTMATSIKEKWEKFQIIMWGNFTRHLNSNNSS